MFFIDTRFPDDAKILSSLKVSNLLGKERWILVRWWRRIYQCKSWYRICLWNLECWPPNLNSFRSGHMEECIRKTPRTPGSISFSVTMSSRLWYTQVAGEWCREKFGIKKWDLVICISDSGWEWFFLFFCTLQRQGIYAPFMDVWERSAGNPYLYHHPCVPMIRGSDDKSAIPSWRIVVIGGFR